MKHSKFLAGLLLAVAFALVASIGCTSLLTQHQKIAVACESVAAGVDAATAAKQAGRITRDQLQAVVDVAASTTKFCEPEPAKALSAIDYAQLLADVAALRASPGVLP